MKQTTKQTTHVSLRGEAEALHTRTKAKQQKPKQQIKDKA